MQNVPSNATLIASEEEFHNDTLRTVNYKPHPTNFHPKLKLRLYLDARYFIAGSTLFGRMEIVSAHSSSLHIGEISVELTAYEEVSATEIVASKAFHSARLVFQGQGLPLSNAVQTTPSQIQSYYPARCGKTTFPFAFDLPDHVASSIFKAPSMALRYVVTGVVQVAYQGMTDTIYKSKEAYVLEIARDMDRVLEGCEMRRLLFGGSGMLQLRVRVDHSLWCAGKKKSVWIRVKNDTRRQVQGLRVGVVERGYVKLEKRPDMEAYRKDVVEVQCNDDDWVFEAGDERNAVVQVYVPTGVRSITDTSLFTISHALVVSLYMGPFSKELTVHLPIVIRHPASIVSHAITVPDVTGYRYSTPPYAKEDTPTPVATPPKPLPKPPLDKKEEEEAYYPPDLRDRYQELVAPSTRRAMVNFEQIMKRASVLDNNLVVEDLVDPMGRFSPSQQDIDLSDDDEDAISPPASPQLKFNYDDMQRGTIKALPGGKTFPGMRVDTPPLSDFSDDESKGKRIRGGPRNMNSPPRAVRQRVTDPTPVEDKGIYSRWFEWGMSFVKVTEEVVRQDGVQTRLVTQEAPQKAVTPPAKLTTPPTKTATPSPRVKHSASKSSLTGEPPSTSLRQRSESFSSSLGKRPSMRQPSGFGRQVRPMSDLLSEDEDDGKRVGFANLATLYH